MAALEARVAVLEERQGAVEELLTAESVGVLEANHRRFVARLRAVEGTS